MNVNKTIKQCPFCNGTARVRKIGNGYAVMCSSCGARGRRVIIKEWHDHKFIAQGQAVNAWNERSGELCLAKLTDKL